MMHNIYLLSAYGWVLYTALMFVFSKDATDKQGKKFNYKQYLYKNWDNAVLSLMFVPIIAHYAVDIWGGVVNDYFEKEWIFREVYYLLVGVLIELLYMAINKARKLREK